MKASQFSLTRAFLLLLTFFFLNSLVPVFGQGGTDREALREKLRQRIEKRKAQIARQPEVSSESIDTSRFTPKQKALLERGWDPALILKSSQGRIPSQRAKAKLDSQIRVLNQQLRKAFGREVLRRLDDGWSPRVAMYELKDYAREPDTLLSPMQVQFFDQHILYFNEPEASYRRGYGHLLPNKAWIFDGELHLVRPAIKSSGGVEMELRIIDDPTKLLEALFGRRQFDDEVYESLSSFRPIVTDNLALSLVKDESRTAIYDRPRLSYWVDGLYRCSIKSDYRNILIAKFFSNEAEYTKIPVIDASERQKGRGDVPSTGYAVNDSAKAIREFGKGFSSLFGKYGKMVNLEEDFEEIADSFYKAPLEAAGAALVVGGGLWMGKKGVSNIIEDAREGAQILHEKGISPYDGQPLTSSSSSSSSSSTSETTTTTKLPSGEIPRDVKIVRSWAHPERGTTLTGDVFQLYDVSVRFVYKSKWNTTRKYQIRHNITDNRWKVIKGPRGESPTRHRTRDDAEDQLITDIKEYNGW